MPNITIEKPESQSAINILNDEENTLNGRIRERAFELFEERGGREGQTLENWFQAEEELLQFPQAHLKERDGSFHLHMEVPGFHATDVRVIALPESLVISARSKHRHSRNHLAAVGEKRIFQRFRLSAPIDTQNVHATLENDSLAITAHKLENANARTVPFSAT
jgi:HSP20 family molecular chaperone IbpA